MTETEPKVIAFLCNFCSYASADLSGSSKHQYPSSVRLIRVMCSSRVDPALILKVFKEGADGILVGGCHLGNCNYINGNYHEVWKISQVKQLLEQSGLEPGRMRLEFFAASDGKRFSEVLSEFVEELKGMGANPVKSEEGAEGKTRLTAAVEAASGERLRTIAGRFINITSEGNVYKQTIEQGKMEELMSKAIVDEFQRNLILELTKGEAKSVKELAKDMGLATDIVLKQVVALKTNNLVAIDSHEGFTPTYISLRGGGD